MIQRLAWYEKARARMAEQNILVQDVADAVGLTPSAIGHYLAGRRHPRPNILKEIAKRIGMSVSELIEDDPAWARDETEVAVLDALRHISDPQRRESALAMLRSLGDVPEDALDDS